MGKYIDMFWNRPHYFILVLRKQRNTLRFGTIEVEDMQALGIDDKLSGIP